MSVCGDIGQGRPKSGNLKELNQSNLPPRPHLAEKPRETGSTFDQPVTLEFLNVSIGMIVIYNTILWFQLDRAVMIIIIMMII